MTERKKAKARSSASPAETTLAEIVPGFTLEELEMLEDAIAQLEAEIKADEQRRNGASPS